MVQPLPRAKYGISLLILIALATGTLAQTQPSVAPAPPPLPGTLPGGRPLGQVVERLYDFVSQVGLSDEQKPKIDSLFNDTRQQLRTLLANPPGDGTAPQKVQQIVQALRGQLAQNLTPQQLQRLRELINQDDTPMPRGRRGRGGRRGVLPGDPEMMMQPPMAGAMPENAPAAAPSKPEPAEIPMLAVGQPAPDFTLADLNNRPVSLSTYKGKVVLLVFGSYSSPSFRDRAAGLEQLRTAYFNRINVLVIYTREHYPAGEWEIVRNKQDLVSIPQHVDMASRIDEAKKARATLHLTAPFLIDTMENTTAAAYGATTNAAFLIARDGTITARQHWFEPYALRRHIDEALK